MLLYRTPLLLLGEMLGSFVAGAFGGSPSNSLGYFYLQLSEPSRGLPQSFIRGYLDHQPIACYDSISGKMETLVPWMEEEKETFRVLEWVFGAELEKLSELSRLTTGLHTWQLVLGCELWEDGSKGGFLHYGYDGMDFISFDSDPRRWVAAQPQAWKIKKKWEEDPWWSERNKVFLEETCIKWLKRYLSYLKKDPLQRTEPPMGKVTRKVVNERREVLTCQAFGFYPKEIQATWTRDGEECKSETLPRNMAPNSDGTYYVRLSIEVDPKERERFRCRLEHEGLQEPLLLAFKEEIAGTLWVPSGIVVALILGTGILLLICWWWRCRKISLELNSCPDPVPFEMVPSPTLDGTKDEIQSQITLDHETSCGLWEAENAFNANMVSTLPRQKQKQQRLKRWKTWAREMEVFLPILAEAGATGMAGAKGLTSHKEYVPTVVAQKRAADLAVDSNGETGVVLEEEESTVDVLPTEAVPSMSQQDLVGSGSRGEELLADARTQRLMRREQQHQRHQKGQGQAATDH